MADLLAGTTVRAADTPVTVSATQNDLYSFNSNTFGVDADSGTYVELGVVFVAATTGRAVISYAAELDNDTAATGTLMCPIVREGTTIGAGTTVVGPDPANAVINRGTDARRFGASLFVSGLTAGSSYNVRMEHRCSGGVGTIQYRNVIVAPAT